MPTSKDAPTTSRVQAADSVATPPSSKTTDKGKKPAKKTQPTQDRKRKALTCRELYAANADRADTDSEIDWTEDDMSDDSEVEEIASKPAPLKRVKTEPTTQLPITDPVSSVRVTVSAVSPKKGKGRLVYKTFT